MTSPATIRITIPGEPQPQRRGTIIVNRHTGRASMKKHKGTAAYQAAVAACGRAAMAGRPPLDGPLWLEVVCVFGRTKDQQRKCRPDGRLLHAVKPDASNVLKAIEDGLEAGGVFVNDSRIVRVTVRKWRAARGEAPHVQVTVGRMLGGNGEAQGAEEGAT